MALADCRLGFAHFQGAGIPLTCLQAASPKPKLLLSKLCSKVQPQLQRLQCEWGAQGSALPQGSLSLHGDCVPEVLCTLRFFCVCHTWEHCEPSQQPPRLQHRHKELQNILCFHFFYLNQNYLRSQYTL